MSDVVEIFVALLGEGVEVWRPVKAEHLSEDRYRIVETNEDSEIEAWEYETGMVVHCAMVDASDGPILAAVRRDRG